MCAFTFIVAFKINKELCKSRNEALYNNGKNLELKDFAHIHDPKIPGSNNIVVFIKKLFPRFRGTFKYLVFKINENIVKGSPDDRIKKTEIRNHFNEWYQTNYQQRPPKATELYEQLENLF